MTQKSLEKYLLELFKLRNKLFSESALGSKYPESANLIEDRHIIASPTILQKIKDRDLSELDIQHSNLSGYDMSGFNFCNSVLTNANLDKSKFDGADFTDADFHTTSIKGTDFSKAKGMVAEQFAFSYMDGKTNLPDYITREEIAHSLVKNATKNPAEEIAITTTLLHMRKPNLDQQLTVFLKRELGKFEKSGKKVNDEVKKHLFDCMKRNGINYKEKPGLKHQR